MKVFKVLFEITLKDSVPTLNEATFQLTTKVEFDKCFQELKKFVVETELYYTITKIDWYNIDKDKFIDCETHIHSYNILFSNMNKANFNKIVRTFSSEFGLTIDTHTEEQAKVITKTTYK